MLNSQKGLHLLQILTAGSTGLYAELMLQVKTVDGFMHWLQVGAQTAIAVVTCWATIRKALQTPKQVSPVQTDGPEE